MSPGRCARSAVELAPNRRAGGVFAVLNVLLLGLPLLLLTRNRRKCGFCGTAVQSGYMSCRGSEWVQFFWKNCWPFLVTLSWMSRWKASRVARIELSASTLISSPSRL